MCVCVCVRAFNSYFDHTIHNNSAVMEECFFFFYLPPVNGHSSDVCRFKVLNQLRL